ncbi:MAG: hypothetical protein BMS9Abin07_1558 [Acidimicrobiia bacterium]|nr:MAG: hypothetical protein BMS9Abin07_1558 [Acidimicrobiia bacterium]
MSDLVMSVKRTLRPLIPDQVMARYRLAQHSKTVRVNVEVAVTDAAETRRWLSTTPDTYRVIDPTHLGEPPQDVIVIPEGADADAAARLLSRPDIAAVVVGEVARPRLVDRRRSEPAIAPTAIVVRPGTLEDIGDVPAGDHPLPGLLARLRDGGHRIGLVPVPQAGADPIRRDPIAAEPVVILAAVPMHDVGGGSRGAQMALELVTRGYHVTYVHLYPSYEQVDLGLRYIHPHLEQVRFDRFDATVLGERTGGSAGVVMLELPAPRYLEVATGLHDAGWDLVYDIIDDWSDPALGGDWFDSEGERDLIATADAVVASAPDLVEHAASAGRDATLVPNAVNASVFATGETDRPVDLPDGPLIGYHGSLYGDWFDWEALADVARRYPDATLVLIGEARRVPEGLPDNVVFLGLKAQQDLPGYLSRFDVGIVPFVVTPTTHAVSPLKVYEYLACAVPVAAPPLRALEGVDGVHTDPDLTRAVAAALAAPRPDSAQALRHHSWGNRLGDLFSALGRDLPEASATPVRIEQRPARHYGRGERRISG